MHSYDTNSYFLISVLTKTDSKATNMCFFKYIFQLIILVPIFTDFADVVFSNPILITTASFCGCIAQTPYSSFVVVLCYSSSFLILFSFLLYIKFGNTGPRDNAQRFSENSPERVYNKPSLFDTIFTPSGVFETYSAGENQTSISGTTKDSAELEQEERPSLLVSRWNLQYST